MKKFLLFWIFFVVGMCFARTMDVEAGKIVLKLQSGKESEVLSRLKQAYGVLDYQRRFDALQDERGMLKDIYLLKIDSQRSPWAVANEINSQEGIIYAEPLFIDGTFAVPNDTFYAEALNFTPMQAEAAWDLQKCEQNPVIIAIVDTGVAYKHPDLAQNIWNNLGEDANNNGYTFYQDGGAWVFDSGDLNGIDDDGNGKIDDLVGWNFLLNSAGDENNDPGDPGSHGTRVAGLAGAVSNNAQGVASLSWNPILMPISCSRAGATSTIIRGYDAILYAAENGAKVINCSWGGSGFSQANKDLIDYVNQLGAVVVAAAGNSNNQVPIYPAAYPGVIAVAALNNDGSKWSGSSYGAFVDFGVPNQNFYTVSPATGYFSGSGTTSYASPIGSAMAALLLSQNPALSAADLRYRIGANCSDIDMQNPNYINKLGGGMVDAYAALSSLNPPQEPFLKLGMFSMGQAKDQSGELALEPSDDISLNLILRNYSDYSGNASFTISSSNPDISILNANHDCTVPADEFFQLEDAFLIHINPGALSQYLSLQLDVSSFLPILSESSFSIEVLINNGGILVWEPVAGGRDLSGSFIRNSLQAIGRDVVYGNVFPGSLSSFEAVFLSFGSVGTNVYRLHEEYIYAAIRDYLQQGGSLYLEGADTIGYDLEYYLGEAEGGLGAHTVLWELLGIESAEDGSANPISMLQAQLPFSNLEFAGSSQLNVNYIDTFVPTGDGAAAFYEDGYGTVGIAGKGDWDQASVVFSYALAELADAGENNRAQLLRDILIWFIDSPEPHIVRTEDGLSLVWEPSPLAASYKVFRATDPYGEFVELATVGAEALPLSISESRAFYKVQALP